jgi:hypothetical protein
VHDRSGEGEARGIGHGSRRGAGGEVTTRGGVDAVLPKLGVHGGHGGVPERRRGSRVCHCVWDRGEWSAGMVLADRGLAEGGGVEEKERGGGSSRATASGSSSPSSPTGKRQ